MKFKTPVDKKIECNYSGIFREAIDLITGFTWQRVRKGLYALESSKNILIPFHRFPTSRLFKKPVNSLEKEREPWKIETENLRRLPNDINFLNDLYLSGSA